MLLLLLLSRFSHARLCATPWMAAHQAPLSLGFSRPDMLLTHSYPEADLRCQCPFSRNQIFAHKKKSHNCFSGVERNNLNKGNKYNKKPVTEQQVILNSEQCNKRGKLMRWQQSHCKIVSDLSHSDETLQWNLLLVTCRNSIIGLIRLICNLLKRWE